jgi:predicted peptidase
MKALTTALLVILVAQTTESAAGTDSPADANSFEKRTFVGASGKELRYRLLKPEGYDPAAKTTYPLVIFLHGIGERGTNNELQLVYGVREFAKPFGEVAF